MKTLYQGVVDSLRFIDKQEIGPTLRTLFAHGAENAREYADALVLIVDESECAIRPRPGDKIVVYGSVYTAKQISVAGDRLRITVERQSREQ